MEVNLEFSDFWVNKYLTRWSANRHAFQLLAGQVLWAAFKSCSSAFAGYRSELASDLLFGFFSRKFDCDAPSLRAHTAHAGCGAWLAIPRD